MPKLEIAPIVGTRIRLRTIGTGDLPLTLAWRNHDEIRRWFVHSAPITWEQHQSWFLAYLERDDDYLFVIEEIERLRKPIGQVSLYRIDRQRGSAEFGRILIGEPDARGAGLAREATALLLSLAFRKWHLRTVYLDVFAENAPAIRLYRHCGFEPTAERGGMVRMEVTSERLDLALAS